MRRCHATVCARRPAWCGEPGGAQAPPWPRLCMLLLPWEEEGGGSLGRARGARLAGPPPRLGVLLGRQGRPRRRMPPPTRLAAIRVGMVRGKPAHRPRPQPSGRETSKGGHPPASSRRAHGHCVSPSSRLGRPLRTPGPTGLGAACHRPRACALRGAVMVEKSLVVEPPARCKYSTRRGCDPPPPGREARRSDRGGLPGKVRHGARHHVGRWIPATPERRSTRESPARTDGSRKWPPDTHFRNPSKEGTS